MQRRQLYSLESALEVLSLTEQYFDDPDGLELALRSREDADKVLPSLELENTHLAAQKMYGQSE